MGIFDKIKAILSDPENSDASSGKPSGATSVNPATPAIPTAPVPPVETRNEATVKSTAIPVTAPENATSATPAGEPSSAVSAMRGSGMTGSATGANPATASAFVMPNRDEYESTEAYLEAIKEAMAEATKQAALSRPPPKNMTEAYLEGIKEVKATKDAEDKMRKDGFSES